MNELCAVCGEDHEPEPTQPTHEANALALKALADVMQELMTRAEKAESDAALAWRRVTELQERGTQLVLERRAAEERAQQGDDEIVICAAVLAANGEVIRCHRHHDGLRAMGDRQLEPAEHERAQGFVTSRNRYVDRHEAMQLQIDAGIDSAAPGGYRGTTLFSEDLY